VESVAPKLQHRTTANNLTLSTRSEPILVGALLRRWENSEKDDKRN
jgi:hypothetical protein